MASDDGEPLGTPWKGFSYPPRVRLRGEPNLKWPESPEFWRCPRCGDPLVRIRNRDGSLAPYQLAMCVRETVQCQGACVDLWTHEPQRGRRVEGAR